MNSAAALQLLARQWKSNLDAALAYAKAGLLIFPCNAKKAPCIPNGFYGATCNPEAVRQWWGQNYPDALIALRTGRENGLVVVDVDDVTVIPGLHLHRTFTVTTPRGGRHYYFTHPGDSVKIKCTQGAIAPKVDTRGDLGYVGIPPSATPKGPYVVSDTTPPQPMPEDLRKRLQEENGLQRDRVTEWQSLSALSLCLSVNREKIVSILNRTLPKADGVRNHSVFLLARGLKFDAGLADAPFSELRSVVLEWHSRALPVIATKDADETLSDFAYAWERVRMPLEGDPVTAALNATRAGGLPKEAGKYQTESTRLLLGICWQLALRSSGAFFLSCHVAGKVMGLSHVMVHKRLRLFVAEGLIEIFHKGDTYNATRYLWKGNGQ
jgi:hypothetical protein